MKTYISTEGAFELDTIRVGDSLMETGGAAPVALLARLPSDECGCPEELWRIDSVIWLIHMEEDGSGHVIAYLGEEEKEWFPRVRSLDYLRVFMFNAHAELQCVPYPPHPGY